VFRGETDKADEPTQRALAIAQALRLPQPLIRAFWTRAIALGPASRPEEQLALFRHALRMALDHELLGQAGIACGNLSDLLFQRDLYADALEVIEQGIGVARRSGDRGVEQFLLCEKSYALSITGRWTEALETMPELPGEGEGPADGLSLVAGAMEVMLHVGRLDDAASLLSRFERLELHGTLQDRVLLLGARAALLAARGRHEGALASGAEAVELATRAGIGSQGRKQGFVWAVDAALALGETQRADELVAAVEAIAPGLRAPFLDAHAHRFRARMTGDEAQFKSAASLFREYDMPFWLAVTRLEHGELLLTSGRAAESAPLLEEAREIFERLGAAPWLERLDRTASGEAVPA
jgi:tetratricopeptide (TPR) repeat protein